MSCWWWLLLGGGTTQMMCVFSWRFVESWKIHVDSIFSWKFVVLIVGLLKSQNFISRFNASEQWKEGPLFVKGICRGFCVTTHLCGDYFISHGIRIPSLNNQYDSTVRVFGHLGWSLLVWISEHQWIAMAWGSILSKKTPTYPWSIP